MKPINFFLIFLSAFVQIMHVSAQRYPFQDPGLPVDQRVEDLVGRMTLEEKVSQMMNDAPAIDRLGIPAYNWWNECLHGVARAGIATVFPQAIGMAATFDADAMYRTATIISDEARAKYHHAISMGSINSTLVLPSGLPISIYSGIPVGAGDRKPTGRIRT